MKRINLTKNRLDKLKFWNKLTYKRQPHFIGSWNIENENLCNEIINFFDKNEILQKKGLTGSGLDQTKKKTTDITVKPSDLKDYKYKCFNNYIDELYKCFIDYQHQWPFINIIKDVDIGSFNVQKYEKGDHFSQIHAERFNLQTSNRLFAWMTYLNNVEDGGETNFTHYNIKIKPEIGKTLIWPVEWTHAHAGEILNSGKKYIITGWMHSQYSKE
jgi:prolyl 4-hydroxylase